MENSDSCSTSIKDTTSNSFPYPFTNKDDDSDEDLWFDDTKPIKFDEDLWMDDTLPIEFDFLNDEDILKHMGACLELSNSNEIMKADYILSEYENFEQETNVTKVFQEDEEANLISSFNGLLVTMPIRGIRVDYTFLHVDMMVDSIGSHEKLSLMDGFLRYS